MSLSDKVIKNTFYYIVFQLFGFAFPLILTPFIISKIGEVQFAIYVLVLGFIGIFNLFDLSISSSFIVFISKYYVKKDFVNLNKYFNTGLFFYILLSLLIVIVAYIFANPLLSLLKIPSELYDTSVKIYNIGLLVFFITTAFSIYSSVLISLQKMYVISTAGIITGFINLIVTIIILSTGYGLVEILWLQLFNVSLTNIITIWYVRKTLPDLKVGYRYLEKGPVTEMAKFGAQMQVSKLASFASEKYDEFLLAYFSVLNNVTYFNIANKISRTGRLIPFQLIPQIAPVASELNANDQPEKLKELFSDITKYLILLSFPVFTFIFVFADLIITTWVGPGFTLSSDILRILAAGNLVNLIFSAPGNTILPNIGVPRFQMREGIIYLGINIFLSYMLIKNYGIYGAAFGNVISVVISSLYVFYVSSKYFSRDKTKLLNENYLKPLIISIFCGVITSGIFFISEKYVYGFSGRLSGLLYLIFLSSVFSAIYAFAVLNVKYLNGKDKALIAKILLKIIPDKFINTEQPNLHRDRLDYENEPVSIFVVTHNRLALLKKCVDKMLPTLGSVNYELIIIDNASSDGTKNFLNEIAVSNERIKIILNDKNLGINSKSMGAELSKGEFIIGVDDDVIEFPDNWVNKMIYAYKNIPGMGYLATDVFQDETTTGAKYSEDMYVKEFYDNGNVVLEVGPTGGWCFMISRDVYRRIGKLVTFKDRIFYAEDGDYVNRIINSGLKYGILSGLKVYHATGDVHNKDFKKVFYEKYDDFSKKEPFAYRIKTLILRTFSIKRYIAKLNEYALKQNL